jgi:hypothetical protein
MHRFRLCGVSARLVLTTALACATLAPAPAFAGQQRPAPAQEPQPAERRADFLFGRPHGSIGVRGSWLFARAGSDLFDFVTRELTIDRHDFDAPGFGLDVAISVAPRVDVIGTFELTQATASSEYRDFVDNNFLPITQTTTLRAMQLGASVRYALTPRGHDVSRFAWVPRRVVPYVGAGGGAIYHRFAQYGDFVDFVDLSVFTDSFRSTGWSPSAHAFGGVDVQLYRALYGSLEGRYQWATGTLGRDFIDFDPIDLAGFRVSGGINVLF